MADIERLIEAIRERVREGFTNRGPAGGDLSLALRHFRSRFATWSIDIPSEDVRLRRAGFLQQEGWLIQYQFGRSGKTEYLDYHASHPMAGNEHVRLYASGGKRRMAAVVWSFLSSGEPEDEARKQRAFYKRNRRIARMLIAKGFDKATMNDFLSVGPADTGSERDVEDNA